MVNQIWSFYRQNYPDETAMKETIFMRVLFCKIQCPLMCFCRPSTAHLYTSGSLKLESVTPNVVVPSTVYVVSGKSSSEGVKEEEGADRKPEAPDTVLKSCMRKICLCPDSRREVGMKKVQWMDHLGKELAEIREFESSESGDTDYVKESNRCLCVIL